MYEFGRWLAMITGWPVHTILFQKKVYYEDRKEQSRWIKGGGLVISNHYHAMDYMVNMFLFTKENPTTKRLLLCGTMMAKEWKH